MSLTAEFAYEKDPLGYFQFQLVMWNQALLGQVGDISTRHSETKKQDPWQGYSNDWDQGYGYLSTVRLNDKRPPEWFALWWVGEWKRRNDELEATNPPGS